MFSLLLYIKTAFTESLPDLMVLQFMLASIFLTGPYYWLIQYRGSSRILLKLSTPSPRGVGATRQGALLLGHVMN